LAVQSVILAEIHRRNRVFLHVEKEGKMEILKVILLAIAVLGLAMAGMALTILLKKGGKFPNTHVSGNKYLKRNGVYCSQTQDRIEQQKANKKISFKNVTFVADKKAN
jgi:hypothetical protein